MGVAGLQGPAMLMRLQVTVSGACGPSPDTAGINPAPRQRDPRRRGRGTDFPAKAAKAAFAGKKALLASRYGADRTGNADGL